MRTEQIKIYKFNELSDEAKETARNWWRSCNYQDNYFSESVIEDAKHIGSLMGLTIKNIYWSGFSSQGDGACFVGEWHKSDVKHRKVAEEMPADLELRSIALHFEVLAEKCAYAGFTVSHRGRYCHENATEFDCNAGDNEDNDTLTPELENDMKETARDFMRWIYAQLKRAFDYQNEDAQVEESIIANEYEFTEEGNIY